MRENQWQMMPIKRLGSLFSGAGFPHEKQGEFDNNIPFFKVKSLGLANKNGYLTPDCDTITEETAKFLGAKIFPKDTIVFAKIGAALLLNRVRRVPLPACIDNNMLGFVVDNSHDVAFVHYALNSIDISKNKTIGPVPTLSNHSILSERVLVPDLRLQQKIAKYLDRETACIDAIIEKNERLIALSGEKLRAEIDSVTQKAPGKVRVRMSKVCDYIPGKHLGVESTTTEPGDVRYLRTADLYEDMSFEKAPLWVLEPKPENIVTSEDVIVCFDGFVANGKTGTLGMAVTGASGHVGASLSIVAPRKDPRYSDDLLRLAHLGNAFREVVVKNAEGVTAKHGQRGTRHFDVYLDPDVDIQKHQARDIRRLIEKTSLLKEKLMSLNALLKEKRSALITAAVTGQIDIPEE